MTEDTSQSTEQPEMDSQDQVVVDEDASNEQSDEASNEVQTAPELIEVNGEMLTLDEIKLGYMRQSDYTKKTQELSQMKQQTFHQKEEGDEDQEIVSKFIAENNLMTQEDVQKLLKKHKSMTDDEIAFNNYVKQYNPTPEQQQVVKQLGYTKGFASQPWDKIHKYAYGSNATTVKKVVNRRAVGVSTKAGSKTTGKITRADLAKMPLSEYSKRTAQEWMQLVSE